MSNFVLMQGEVAVSAGKTRLGTYNAYPVLRLNFGDAIAGRLFHSSALQTVAGFSNSAGQPFQWGKFTPSHQSGYFGFKAGSYYGWLKLKVDFSGNSPDGFSLVDNGDGIFGAYDKAGDISADAFRAGSVEAVPEPSVTALGGLGLLAMGAIGVREMRRRRKALASS